MSAGFDISVGSATDYDDLIAEIKFSEKAGFIVSKEPGDSEYKVSAHSFPDSSAEDFDFVRNIEEYKIELSELISALEEARRRLEALG